jgi:hypothetical protein
MEQLTTTPSSFWRQIFPIRLLCDQSEVEILIGKLRFGRVLILCGPPKVHFSRWALISCINTIFYVWCTWKLSHSAMVMHTAFPMEWLYYHRHYRILSWVHFVYFLENHHRNNQEEFVVFRKKYISKTCIPYVPFRNICLETYLS